MAWGWVGGDCMSGGAALQIRANPSGERGVQRPNRDVTSAPIIFEISTTTALSFVGCHSDIGYTGAANSPNASDLLPARSGLHTQRALISLERRRAASRASALRVWRSQEIRAGSWRAELEIGTEQIRSIRSIRCIRIAPGRSGVPCGPKPLSSRSREVVRA